jgi:hypothetical protein
MKPRRKKLRMPHKAFTKGEHTMFTPRRQQHQPETAQQPASTGAQTGYMAELEEWLDFTIFEPIENAIATGDTKELHLTFSECKQLLKRKVLASYHNGLKAKQTSNPKNNGQPTYRRN